MISSMISWPFSLQTNIGKSSLLYRPVPREPVACDIMMRRRHQCQAQDINNGEDYQGGASKTTTSNLYTQAEDKLQQHSTARLVTTTPKSSPRGVTSSQHVLLHQPLPFPQPAALPLIINSDLLVSVLSFLGQRDRATALSLSRWIRGERASVVRELDLKQPPASSTTTSTAESSIISFLQGAPFARRMKYRGDVGMLSRALSSTNIALSRLLAMDLCECSICPSSCKLLAQALSSGACPRLAHLDLSDNPSIGSEGVECLAKPIQEGALPSLAGLLLFGDRIGQQGGLAIAKALASGAVPKLEILDLSGNGLGTEAALALASALETKQCHGLSQLGLSDNDIESAGVEALARALGIRAASGCAKLEKLHLGGNNVGAFAAGCLAEALKSHGCGDRLALLELHSGRLGAQGVRVIAEVMRSRAVHALKELWLDDNAESEEDSEAVQDLMNVLATGALPGLEALGLNWTGLGSAGAAALASALTTYPRANLIRLDLRSTCLTGPGLTPLVDALIGGAIPALRWIDLSGNALFLHGAKEIARALAAGAAKCLRRLDMHAVGLEDDGLKEIAQVLKLNVAPELLGLGLALNRIGSDGAQELAIAMENGGLAKLVGLEMHKNEIGDMGVQNLATVLGKGACPNLMYLGWSNNRISDRGATALAKLLPQTGFERLNLSDNRIGPVGLKALQLMAARKQPGVRVRVELSGNSSRGYIPRHGPFHKALEQLSLWLLIFIGSLAGAVAVKSIVKNDLQSSMLHQACLGICGILMGGLQCSLVIQAWTELVRDEAGEMEAAAAAAAPVVEEGTASHISPFYILSAVFAGDVGFLTWTSIVKDFTDSNMIQIWVFTLFIGYILNLIRNHWWSVA